MKKWLVAASMMTLLTSCAYSPIYNGKEPYSGSQFMLMDSPRHTMDFFIESMTEDLMVSNVAVSARTPIAITSFVDLQNMDATNWLGNSVSEGFIHQFQRRGFKVVDFKTTGSIQVTQQGDFALSRDWQDLAQEQQIQYVLTGPCFVKKVAYWLMLALLVCKAVLWLPQRKGSCLQTESAVIWIR